MKRTPKLADSSWFQSAMKNKLFAAFKWLIAGKDKETVEPKKRFILLRPFRAYMIVLIPLLYVGLTRARLHLWLGWAARRPGASGREQSRRPSRFLDDLVPAGGGRVRPRAVAAAIGRAPAASARTGGPLVEALRAWRRERAKADGVPAYVVFNDRTLFALADRQPRSRGELLAVEGIGPTKLDQYGDDLLAVLAAGQR